jgi:hypothetical protein
VSWKLVVRTFEQQGNDDRKLTPVLEHSFFGKTMEDALHYSDSHSRTDSFYRDTGGALAARESHRRNGAFIIVKGHFRDVPTLTEAEFKKRKR